MMRFSFRSLFIVGLMLLVFDLPLYAGDKVKFPVNDIPKDLLLNASAVLRMNNDAFARTTEKRAVETIDYAVTVLNKSGKYYGYFVQPYTRFSSVSNIKAVVYDAQGKKVKTIKQDDINDELADFGRSLYSDIRMKLIDPDYDHYPYTVEYSCQIDYSGSMNLPSWQVIPHYDMAVQDESFSLITPDKGDQNSPLAVHYYLNKKDIPLQCKVQDGKTTYSLHESNIKAVQEEDFSPELEQISPTVRFAPVSFTIAGYQGGTGSWNAFGAFIRQLNAGRDQLPPTTAYKIRKLADSARTFNEKVALIYSYMQNKVRYVSISKGIQSWQPMEAQTVDQVSYGDCKALTNYMKALLEADSIKSYYTLVQAGADAAPVIAKFPSNQFDHAILCVPHGADTIWLECTDQHIPAGYIGTFSDDRNVLVILNDTVKIAHTKIYSEEENSEHSKTLVKVETNGDCQMAVQKTFSGLFYDEMLPLSLADAQKQRLGLLQTIHLPTFQLQKFSFLEERKTLPVLNSNMVLNVPRYATQIGNMMLLRLFPLLGDNSNDFRTNQRYAEILIRRSYSRVDTVVFEVPNGFSVAKLPAGKKITTSFATYDISGEKQGNKVIFTRKLIMNKGTYPASQNADFSKFFDEVNKLDGSRMVLTKM